MYIARTITVDLGHELRDFIESLIESGDYRTQSEVIRESLRLLREKQAESRLQTLRNLLAEGLSSGEPVVWEKDSIPKIKTYAPDATYLMWLDCRELGMGNEALHDFMIRKAKLGLNDGCSFGRSLNGFMRLNAACPRATLEQAMRQLEAAVNSL